jgi:hypothetical protein
MNYMCEILEDEKTLSQSIIYVFIRSICVQTDICYIIHSCQLTTAFPQLTARIKFSRIYS